MNGWERMLAERREEIERLQKALAQLLHEVIAAGFETAEDYNWPKAIADAKLAISELPAPPDDPDPTGTESAVISSG